MKYHLFKWISAGSMIFLLGIMVVFNSCVPLDFREKPVRDGIKGISISHDKTQILIMIGYDSTCEYGGLWISDILFENWHRLWDGCGKNLIYASWSPDGKNICFTYVDGKGRKLYYPLAVISFPGGIFRLLLEDGEGRVARWSPTENIIASIAAYGKDLQKKIVLFDLDKDEEIILLENIASWGSWGWLPDGRKIIYSPKEVHEIRVIDVFSLEEEVILEGFVPWNPVFSFDGKKMVFENSISAKRSYFIASLNSDGEWEASRIDHADLIISFANWSPDNTSIALWTTDRKKDSATLWIMDPITQTKKKILDIPRRGFTSIDWLSDSEIIFSDGLTISTINIDGTGLKQVFSLEQFEKKQAGR